VVAEGSSTIGSVSDQSHPAPAPDPGPVAPEAELSIDPMAFLPRDVEIDAEASADPWGDATPEPEVPTWARADGDDLVSPSAPGVAAPVESPSGAIDLEALSVLERDLDAVDAALAALDAGEPARSPLLVDLLDLA